MKAGKRAPSATLEKRLRELGRRVDALEARLAERESPAVPVPAISPADAGLVDLLRGRRGGPYEQGKRRGAVLYAGALEVEGREYLWEMERPLPGLLAVKAEAIAALLSSLASPQRLQLLRALLGGPKSSQELQEALGISSPGQLYHHLKELTAAGIVEQRDRSAYQLSARRVVPFLAIVAAALDLA